MNKNIKFLQKITLLVFINLNFLSFIFSQELLLDKPDIENFKAWDSSCLSMNANKTFITNDQIFKIFNSFFSTMQENLNKTYWLETPKNLINAQQEFKGACDMFAQQTNPEFTHVFRDSVFKYAQKVIVPENTTILVSGDLHGSYLTLSKLLNHWINLGYLNNNLQVKDNTYIIFLGDYKDRGYLGLEITATLMQLKNLNPHNFIMFRGNHEHYYYDEQVIKNKFPNKFNSIFSLLNSCFEVLPDVIYFGFKNNNNFINYFQVNHGGMEKKYNPENLLIANNNSNNIYSSQELPLDYADFKWSYIINKNRDTEINRYIWFGMHMKELHNDKIVDYINNNLKKDGYFKITGMVNGHNHEAPKKETLCNLYPEKQDSIKLLKERELIEKYYEKTQEPTTGFCNLGTQETPIIITIAGPMLSSLPKKDNPQEFETGLNYAVNYITLKPGINTWDWQANLIN
ncbi:MAG: Serine/threonine-protein phosphatase [candidate division TM6 bacterium GW2011_GWF2_28_16]|nr:MAG: Serine/threonine-protein phosphatase [candidate division TM6 bacterium GW2011_GWF2_28_16]